LLKTNKEQREKGKTQKNQATIKKKGLNKEQETRTRGE
jgi:hypothetical protein